METLNNQKAQVPMRKQARADAQRYSLNEGVASYDHMLAASLPPPYQRVRVAAIPNSKQQAPSNSTTASENCCNSWPPAIPTKGSPNCGNRSPATVRNQLSTLYQKLGVARRTEALAKARR